MWGLDYMGLVSVASQGLGVDPGFSKGGFHSVCARDFRFASAHYILACAY